MTFALPDLRYGYDALEPFVDREALRWHHAVCHRGYVDAINRLLVSHPDLNGQTVETLLRRLDEAPARIRQDVQHLAGGHANHQFQWKVIAPQARAEPRGALAEAIDADFGSFAAFREAFTAAALRLEPEGWAFLSLSAPRTGHLEILTLAGNGSVLPIGKPGILICDLWPHAAGERQPEREAYLETYWRIVDWPACEARLAGLREGRSQL